jgi:hypothetical protein
VARSLEHLKKRFVEDGISAAIERKTRETPPCEIQTKSDLITLEMEDHSIIVVSPKEHLESEAELLEIYGISKSKNVVGTAR